MCIESNHPDKLLPFLKKKRTFFFFKDLVKRDLLQMSHSGVAKSFFSEGKLRYLNE